MIEAIFLVRAFRATLPRFGATEPVDTGAMQVRAAFPRPSRIFRRPDSGPTFDYTHRCSIRNWWKGPRRRRRAAEASIVTMPRVTDTRAATA